MTTQPTTPKRWRPRFSLRTLVILVTIVCFYAASWGPDKPAAAVIKKMPALGKLADAAMGSRTQGQLPIGYQMLRELESRVFDWLLIFAVCATGDE
jgi:hypothetical protein